MGAACRYCRKKTPGYATLAVDYKALDVGRVHYGMDVIFIKDDKELWLLAVYLKSGCFNIPLNLNHVSAVSDASKKNAKRKPACQKLSKQIKPLEA